MNDIAGMETVETVETVRTVGTAGAGGSRGSIPPRPPQYRGPQARAVPPPRGFTTPARQAAERMAKASSAASSASPSSTSSTSPARASKARPVIFSGEHVRRALSDPNFFSLMPEFATLQRKMEAAKTNLAPGCSSCAHRRAAKSFGSDFVSILGTLSLDALARLKKYVGAERLLVRGTNRQTGRMELREV